MHVPSTLIRIETKQGVLAPKADAESPASSGSALGVGDLHEVYVAVGGNEVHAAQWVRVSASLPEGGPRLVPQLQGKLGEKEGNIMGSRTQTKLGESTSCMTDSSNICGVCL